MCTNRALVDSLECYMDDLVDCFEDFVKKSLIFISVGIASLVAMFIYMIKVLTDRTGTPNTAVETNEQNLRDHHSDRSIPSNSSRGSSKRNVKSDFLLSCSPKVVCSSANTQPLPAISSFEERVLDEIRYANYIKPCELKSKTLQTDSSRTIIPSLPTGLQKQHLPPRNCVKVLRRSSCCSVCCEDDKSSMYTHQNRRSPVPTPTTVEKTDLSRLTAMAAQYFWTAYATMNGNYMAVLTVVLIVILSFVLPDLSQKIHRTNELKEMKKVLKMMTKEVRTAEVACLTVADEICCLHCSMHDGATETLKDQKDLSVCTSGCMRSTRSEPVQVEKIGFFRRIFFPKKNTSHKEVTIMSYLYTDSFDANKAEDANNHSEVIVN